MNSIDVQTFLEIVRVGSISGAANMLYLSQSSVSQRLQNLEKELNCTLITRGKGLKSLELTPAGEQFLQIAKSWVSLYDDMKNIQHTRNRSKLSIAAVEWINAFAFGHFLSEFALFSPDIQLELYTRHSSEVYRMVANHEVDLGFVVRPFQFTGVRTISLFSDEMYLVCHKGTYPPDTVIHPSDLNPAEELRWNYIYEYANWHDQWFDPNCAVNLQLDSASMILNFLGHAGRWSIMPASVVRCFQHRNDIAFFRIVPSPPQITYYKVEQLHPRESRRTSIHRFNDYLGDHMHFRQSPVF